MAQQPLPTSAVPTDIYGGDEIAALVLDPGYSSTRAGFAGEDIPKAIFPSDCGYVPPTSSRPARGLLFGEDCLVPRPDIEIRNYMSRDGIVEDWDTAARLWEGMLVRQLHSPRPTVSSRNGLNDDPKDEIVDGQGDVQMGEGGDGNSAAAAAAGGNGEDDDAAEAAAGEKSLQENPLLLTEAPQNPAKTREKTVEIVMENWGCPAFWLSRTPVLAAFAGGKASALVVDVGAGGTSVTCVHDGMMLKKSAQRSPVGSIWVSGQTRSLFASLNPKVDLVPTFMIEAKTAVDAGASPQAKLRKFGYPISDSLRTHYEERVLGAFKESVVEVWRGQGKFLALGNEEFVRSQPGPVFEMPDGSNQMWREQRFRVAEGMFDDTAQLAPVDGSAPITAAQTVPQLIRAALESVDADLRPNLLNNIVVTGGGSLIKGFNDRLNNELIALYPGVKVKITSAGLTTDRRFGAWVGGSILASLGTFHQMWISRKEYEEHGVNIVEKRCK